MGRAVNVLDYLDCSISRFPEKTALADDERAVSYEELGHLVERIGTGLSHSLGTVNEPVVVLANRKIESICCFLAVVASHNFYVPVDANVPEERLMAIFGQVAPKAVVELEPSNLDLESLAPNSSVLRYQELAQTEPDCALLADLRRSTLEDDPVYAVCTSGSTGTPKAVVKAHRSVTSFIPVFAETFSFAEDDAFANQAPFDFDVSAKDIYTSLYCGASLHIVPKAHFAMPKQLGPYLEERGITCCIWAVSALCVVAQLNAFKNTRPPAIRRVLFSGEVMPIKHLEKWRSWYPDAVFANLYAPTEVTGNCLYYRIEPGMELSDELPLGVPFKNSQVLVLDDSMQPITAGQIGEIYIRGGNLALGYYRNPTQTAAAFVQNPLNPDFPDRVYKTGDVARLAADGHYYFAGRKDFQIKHMGHRIELEELELNLTLVAGVERACCVFDSKRNKIVAFYEGAAETPEIMKDMGKRLPKYMIPNIFQKVEQLPMTARGKIDRQGLRAMLAK